LRSGKIQTDDLVYCLRGATFGKTAFVTPYTNGAIASSLMIIRPDLPKSNKLIYYYLISPLGREQIFRFDNGSAQPNLSANSVKSYTFPLPPLAEQKEIVRQLEAAFVRIDALKELHTNLTKQHADLTQSLLAKAFRGELVPQEE